MAGVNKAILIGHLGADPDIRTGASGAQVATFSLATSEVWRDKASGERKERTQWHRVVVFSEGLIKGPLAYLKKGSKAYVEGAIETRKWTGQDGAERYTTEIVLRNFHSALHLLDRAERPPPPEDDARAAAPATPAAPAIDDEIPF